MKINYKYDNTNFYKYLAYKFKLCYSRNMNIFLINGSPKGKNSNSLKLANSFIDGIKNASEKSKQTVELREATLNTMDIHSCLGCFSCWKNTPGKCCINDDMSKIIEGQLWADIIIFCFPLYFFNVPGILKNVIDRQLPMSLPFMSERTDGIGNGSHQLRYNMDNKKYVLISTCGFYTAEKNYDSVVSMFNHICGKNNFETIFCGQGELFSIKELSEKTDSYLKNVKQAGIEFASQNKITEKTKDKLKTLLFEKEVFEKMADASWGIEQNNSSESSTEKNESLIFTKQMAALYNTKNYDGKDRILEMHYTDINKTYQVILTAEGSSVIENPTTKYTTRIETPFEVWVAISRGELNGMKALITGKYKVIGDVTLMMKWGKLFG